MGTTQTTGTTAGLTQSSSVPQIDIAHLRNTTKFDHLQTDLQKDIEGLDNAIINSQNDCSALAELIKAVQSAGQQTAPAIDFVNTKLEELEQGLENDAEAIVSFKNGDLKQDEAEVKCIFRTVDRLKVPRQYQIAGEGNGSNVLGASTSNGTGLSGWWNQPQTLRGARTTTGVGAQSVQLVNDDAEDGSNSGPKTMMDLFDKRTETFKRVNDDQKKLLAEIEDFIEGLEDKITTKERELNDRINYGNGNAAEKKEAEKERRMNQLRFVFGEVQRGLFEVADKVSTTRDGIVELGMLR